MLRNVYLFYFFVALLLGCTKDEELAVIPISKSVDYGTYNPTYIIPEELPSIPPMNNPNFNLLTEEGIVLGKKLYYDNILSTNGKSCSSCHIPQYSYSLPIMGPINTAIMPHVNLGWYKAYGWSGGEELLDHVALADLAEGNPFLNANSDSILNRFSRSFEYQQLFWKAFGVKIIDLPVAERNKYISYSLAQFLRTLVSKDAKFDRYLRGEVALTSSEINGFAIFMDDEKGDCFHCHGNAANPLWTDGEFHNNALDSIFVSVNQGRFLVTGNLFDLGKFRTPTLRNIELTAPYMHDNRFATLEEVIDFYSEDLRNSPYVDPLMQKIGQGGVHITPSEKVDLIAFLKTLTDTSFISNPDFQ
ncbi:MAG: cytochrome-c peroxidase [Vicingus serpentipes]|nr:cytochrome-c peroxidase [Vicingus serpentipes]